MSTENSEKGSVLGFFFYLKGWQWGRNKGCISKKGSTMAKNKGGVSERKKLGMHKGRE